MSQLGSRYFWGICSDRETDAAGLAVSVFVRAGKIIFCAGEICENRPGDRDI